MASINVQGYRPHNALSALAVTTPTPQSCVNYPTYYYRCVIDDQLIRLSPRPHFPIFLFHYYTSLFLSGTLKRLTPKEVWHPCQWEASPSQLSALQWSHSSLQTTSKQQHRIYLKSPSSLPPPPYSTNCRWGGVGWGGHSWELNGLLWREEEKKRGRIRGMCLSFDRMYPISLKTFASLLSRSGMESVYSTHTFVCLLFERYFTLHVVQDLLLLSVHTLK